MEATHGLPLIDIIVDEYQSVYPDEARLLYLDICSLHRFGPPVRAGLISRIHNISFHDFRKVLFEPLEAIVVLREDKRSGDYVYEARHSHIAHTLYESVLQSQEERFDNIARIVGKLNPSYSYDLEVIAKLVRSANLLSVLSDQAKIRQVYDMAQSALGERAVIHHQRGVFEMTVAVNLGALDVARELLEKAINIEPHNRSIKHSLAEVDLKRSRLATDPLARETWRRSAVERAAALATKGSSPYPHHTLLKAAIDAVKDALVLAENNQSEAVSQELGERLASAEGVLKRGLQAFPNEATLLAGEGELSAVLSEAVRSETAFEKAFAANPRSTLTAKRLARIKRSRGEYAAAQKVLQCCLEFNPGAQDLHYGIAMTIMGSAPDADQAKTETILYHLRRSHSPNDRNRQAQFWYARQLCIAGQFSEARPIFQTLSDVGLPFKERRRVQGCVQSGDGTPHECVGTVTLLRDSYGFVRCEEMNLTAFFYTGDGADVEWDDVLVGSVMRFQLGFNLFGPVAVNIDLRTDSVR